MHIQMLDSEQMFGESVVKNHTSIPLLRNQCTTSITLKLVAYLKVSKVHTVAEVIAWIVDKKTLKFGRMFVESDWSVCSSQSSAVW